MSLPAPNLDDRTFEQLVEEARTRIPQFTPEWSNFNDSDPGMALVQLHAWLTETILYRLNQVPDLNYIKFLELLNITPRPATPARAELTFKLKKLNQPDDSLLVMVPQGTRVAVDDPELEEELIFETDRTLRAVNASLAVIIAPVPEEEAAGGSSRVLVTTFDDDLREAAIPNPFYPFGRQPVVDVASSPYFLIGLLLRPHRRESVEYILDRFPSGELDLTFFVPQVFEKDAEQQEIRGPKSLSCLFPWEISERGGAVIWEAYLGTQHREHFESDEHWQQLVSMDQTAGLTRSGHVFLEMPGNLPTAGFRDLAADAEVWDGLGQKKPPTDKQELIDAITEGIFDPKELDIAQWEALGIENPEVCNASDLIDQINSVATLNFAALTESDWVDAGFDPAPVPYRLVWLRGRLQEMPGDAPQVSQVLLNTVGATAAVTVTDEIVGTSNGRPNQTFRLRRSPVIVDQAIRKPELTVEIRTFEELETWEPVDDFFGKGPTDPVFVFDPQTGTLRFGDGVFGRIPVAGAEIIARRYRHGGGSIGNVGRGTVTSLRGALFDVDSVTNHRAAFGGASAESLDEVKLRAPHDLRTRDRAVTAEDFAELALQTPGVSIHTAFALPLTRADTSTDPPTLDAPHPGAVTVVVLPESKEPTPQPTEDELRLVCAHLNQRRLITTELYVIGPRYLRIQRLRAQITINRHSDLKAVSDAVTQRLLSYFHPLSGGEGRRGWPLGQDIFFGNVYRQILSETGVLRVLCLEIIPDDPEVQLCPDVVSVPDGTLVELPRTAIDLEVSYDPYG